MNNRQLQKIGVPEDCLRPAVAAVERAASMGGMKGKQVKESIKAVLERPEQYLSDEHFGPLATALVESRKEIHSEPISYRTWGSDIDGAAHAQMRQACSLPSAVAAALMPDAHVGYGLPIGGVLATEGAVVPYAVGVDIACRMKLSILDLPPADLSKRLSLFKDALERGTRFGIGSHYQTPKDHPVMDLDWNVSRVTREKKALAWKQLGTSGSGNHFVEFGVLEVPAPIVALDLQAGEYTALLSHSGSRGVGASVCDVYSNIARGRLPKRHEQLGRLAWLDLDSEAGQEYWRAMNLMGDYAAANHAVIHRQTTKLLGAQVVASVENHHNFAWKETHFGREVIVHRKGATPAGEGQLGVIPGTMADPAYLVRGKGNRESLTSASHGAGRRMSRTAARDKYRWNAVQKDLEKKGIIVLSAAADESPGVYKNIDEVMSQQADLVETLGRFFPRIVKMNGDGGPAED
jgi:tRNA-splicing ligase RtcB